MTRNESAGRKASEELVGSLQGDGQDSDLLTKGGAPQKATRGKLPPAEKEGIDLGQLPEPEERSESSSGEIEQPAKSFSPFASCAKTGRSTFFDLPQRPLQKPFSLLALTEEDAQALAQCSNVCFLDLRDPPWDASAYHDLLKEPSRVQGWKVVNKGNEVVAFILLMDAVETWEVLKLAVRPSYRRQGIAQRLLTQALTAGTKRTLILEVMASNAAALALYKRVGFQEIARRPKYYRHPSLPSVDAILLKAEEKPATKLLPL